MLRRRTSAPPGTARGLVRRSVPAVVAGLAALLGALHLQSTAGGAAPAPAGYVPPGPALAALPAADSGYVIRNDVVVRNCASCHRPDAEGRLGRISFMRKTPEGWQGSVRRMVTLHGVQMDPAAAREVVRYLATHQGLAPEELRPGRFEVESRMIEFRYTADRDTERTCQACHSLGRVITQRRTVEEWKLLLATHRTLYPLVDRQVYRNFGPPPRGATGAAADRRHPMDRALEHLTTTFPLETPEWSAWSANLRPARLEGTWALAGNDPGRGPLFGSLVVRPVPGRDDEFTSEATYTFAESGETVRRSGRSTVYTGYQWRGRSGGEADGLREVMMVERGQAEMSGRWFAGEYDELGVDVTLRRVSREPAISGVHPRALRAGVAAQEVHVYGANLPERIAAADLDLGPGVRVRGVSRDSPGLAVLRVDVDAGAPVGARDLYLAGATRTDAVVVHDRVDAIRIRPRAGMARIGGEWRPGQLQQFEAIAYHNGPDGRPGTADDLELGRVRPQWSIEEYPVTFEDDDVRYVGAIDANGLFTPGADGPNPERSGNRNNIGEVYVVASYTPPGAADARPLRARAHLLVTVPLYMQWNRWAGGQ
jgi:quinohemoprotein amine dehydrogenase